MFLIEKNRHPSVETKPDPRSIEGLIAWLETKEPNETYCYSDHGACLIGQYFAASGIAFGAIFSCGVYHDSNGTRCLYPRLFDEIAILGPAHFPAH